MNEEVDIRSPGGRSRANMLWRMREARGGGDTWHDQTTEKKIKKRLLTRLNRICGTNTCRIQLWPCLKLCGGVARSGLFDGRIGSLVVCALSGELERQSKHGGHPTILARWYAQEGYRRSLAEHNIGEKEIMLYDRIALERHDFTATRADRLQNAKHWILRLNADGPQRPLRQRPEFVDALEQCLKNARCSPGGHATISDTDTSTSSTASTTKSAIRRRRQLRLLCNLQNWMAVLQRATGKPAGSIFIFIFNFAVAIFGMANEMELMAAYIISEVVVISVSWKEF